MSRNLRRIPVRALLPGLALLFLSFSRPAVLHAQGAADEALPKRAPSEETRSLAGRWVRSDYPYVIEISAVKGDGTMEAAYYNPRPINVGRAGFEESVAGPVVTVELQDANYPGSTYTLTYDRTRDILFGTYFQAVQGETFAVIFVREK